MELNNIEQLLESYFEGTTSLADEQILRNYFATDLVDDSLKQYSSLFNAMTVSASETSTTTFTVPVTEKKPFNKWWLSIAASIVIVLGVAGFVFSENSLTQEEQKALAALKQSKEAMLLLSNNLQKGTSQLQLVETFSKTKNKFLK
ncbi:hypothetical protein [Patiriisocius marinus]|uniref:Uncharacterized protein n=1 Tax=Patiriisocius marinus TaxID=1397112 RepID=A0A5J4J0A5_9FLAO|nr:hypothetical protein [Patiriisocius marinus]GER59183.1 hypothetical protein ULMA_12910 [Patiriisocius marinus]